VQVRKKPAGKKSEAAAKPKSVAQKLQAARRSTTRPRERLICYDAIFAPQPGQAARRKGSMIAAS
jgi:hypothetical protein